MGELLEKNRVEYETLLHAVADVCRKTSGNLPMKLWSIFPSGAMNQALRSFMLERGLNESGAPLNPVFEPLVKTVWEAAVRFTESAGMNSVFALHRSGDSSEPIATFTVHSTTDPSASSLLVPDETEYSHAVFERFATHAIQTLADMNKTYLVVTERVLALQASTIERQAGLLERYAVLIETLSTHVAALTPKPS